MIEFIDIPGLQGHYQISRNGDIRSIERTITNKRGSIMTIKGKDMRLFIDTTGYKHCILGLNGKRVHIKSHRAVALAFIPNPLNLPCVNHKDCNKLNNSVDNLEWVSIRGNAIHASKMGVLKGFKGSSNPHSKLTEEIVRKIVAERGKHTVKSLGVKYSVTRCCISSIFRGDTWSHVSGIKKRKRDENRIILEDKRKYNHVTKPFVDRRGKYKNKTASHILTAA